MRDVDHDDGMNPIRIALLIVQVVAIPVFAIALSDLYRKALDAYNAAQARKDAPTLPADTILDRGSQPLLAFMIDTRHIEEEPRNRIRRLRFWLAMAGLNMVLLAANLFLR